MFIFYIFCINWYNCQKLATIIAMVFAVIIYGLAIVTLKVFSKEEILQLPSGNRIYGLLRKLKIY